MKWSPAKKTEPFGIDWLAIGDQPVDPYLIWFDVVGLDLVGADNFKCWYGGQLPLLLELHKQFDGLADSKVEVPAIYDKPLGRDGPKARFVSARVAPGRLGALLADKRIKRLQLELSRILHTEREAAVTPPSAPPGALPSKEGVVPQTWLGVIDMGCAFAHQNCRSESPGNPGAVATRVRYLWDQNPTRIALQNNWRVTTGLGYGAELGPAEFDLAMADFQSEEVSYAKVGSESVLDMRAQHGFGVLDLAAGRPSPLVVGPPPLEGDPDAAAA